MSDLYLDELRKKIREYARMSACPGDYYDLKHKETLQKFLDYWHRYFKGSPTI